MNNSIAEVRFRVIEYLKDEHYNKSFPSKDQDLLIERLKKVRECKTFAQLQFVVSEIVDEEFFINTLVAVLDEREN